VLLRNIGSNISGEWNQEKKLKAGRKAFRTQNQNRRVERVESTSGVHRLSGGTFTEIAWVLTNPPRREPFSDTTSSAVISSSSEETTFVNSIAL